MNERCNLGVGCEEAGVCFALAHGEPDRCGALAPAIDFDSDEPLVCNPNRPDAETCDSCQ